MNGDAGQGANENFRRPLEREEGIRILKALAEVTPDDDGEAAVAFERAVRFLLYYLWGSWVLGGVESEELLSGSWAGAVLQRMKAHHEAQRDAQRKFEELNTPAEIEKRREEKKRLKQERHESRLAKKKEHDRVWFEQHPTKHPVPAQSPDQPSAGTPSRLGFVDGAREA